VGLCCGSAGLLPSGGRCPGRGSGGCAGSGAGSSLPQAGHAGQTLPGRAYLGGSACAAGSSRSWETPRSAHPAGLLDAAPLPAEAECCKAALSVMDLLINIYCCREIPVSKLCVFSGLSRWKRSVCPISEWDASAREEVSRLVFGQQGACSLGQLLVVG